MRVPVVLICLVVAGLAGCVQTPDVLEPVETALEKGDAPQVLAWRAESCDAAIGVIPVPAEALAPHLPEGFRPLAPEELGLPPDPRGDATFAIEAFRCDAYDSNGKQLTDAPVGGFFTFVEAPADLAEDVDFSFFRWDSLVPDADLHRILVEAGFPMREGDNTVRADLPTGTGKGPILAELVLGSETYGFEGMAGGEWQDATEGRFTEWTPTTNGELGIWRAAFDWDEISTGAGEMTLAPGSLPAEVVGANRAPAYFLWGLLNLDGDITLPSA